MRRAAMLALAGCLLAPLAARADVPVASKQFAPACSEVKQDTASALAKAMFTKLPREPKGGKATYALACAKAGVTVYVFDYGDASVAEQEAHVLGSYLWGASGPRAATADQILLAGGVVVVLSPASPAASAVLAKLGYRPYSPAATATPAARTTAQLIEVFRGSDYDAMDGALAELAKQGAAAVAELTAALADARPMVRSQSAAALGKIGSAAAPAVTALIHLLADPDPDNRWNAANALGAIGPPAKAARGPLEKLANDKVPAVAQAAAEARAKLGR